MSIKLPMLVLLLLTVFAAHSSSTGNIEFHGRVTEGTCSHDLSTQKLTIHCYRGDNGINKYELNINENLTDLGRVGKKINDIHITHSRESHEVVSYNITYN